MSLAAALATLDANFDAFTAHAKDFAASKPVINSSGIFTIADEFQLEGLLSRCWQVWCQFCRECVVGSCLGTTTISGTVVPALPQATAVELVSGAAIRVKSGARPPYWGRSNSLLRSEPTWGDTDVLANILTRLAPANSSQLLAAFSSSSGYAKAMQYIRNSAAHDNAQTRSELQQLQSSYTVFPIGHPTHCLYWAEPTSGDFLIVDVLQKLKSFAAVAVY